VPSTEPPVRDPHKANNHHNSGNNENPSIAPASSSARARAAGLCFVGAAILAEFNRALGTVHAETPRPGGALKEEEYNHG